MTGTQLLKLAETHLGERYVLGSIAPKNARNYRGPWDCAELATYLVYQLSIPRIGDTYEAPNMPGLPVGKITGLYGCANNEGDPAGADAYSGFWDRDANRLGDKITVPEAIVTPGAVLLRVAAGGLIGHVAISDGRGGTIEAHSTTRGVIRAQAITRRWDYGVLIPWFTYQTNPTAPAELNLGTIYRLTKPMMRDKNIEAIQQALRTVKVDGWYGRETREAVREFQRARGLVADGEVGPQTWRMLFD